MKHLFNITYEWFEYNEKYYYRTLDRSKTFYNWFHGITDSIVNMALFEKLEIEYQKLKHE